MPMQFQVFTFAMKSKPDDKTLKSKDRTRDMANVIAIIVNMGKGKRREDKGEERGEDEVRQENRGGREEDETGREGKRRE